MAEKELRKLNRRELLKLLLIQCEEMDRMQQEYDEMKTKLETFMESYERLKGKLNVKDERLNQKDAKIAELTGRIEEMEAAKAMMPPEPGSIAVATAQLNKIFEDAQKKADQYLKSLRSVEVSEEREQHIPFDPTLKSKVRRRQSLIPIGRRTNVFMEAPAEDEEQRGAMHG